MMTMLISALLFLIVWNLVGPSQSLSQQRFTSLEPSPPAAAAAAAVVLKRRSLLAGLVASTPAFLFVGLVEPSHAAATTPGEAIRRSAANIPGFGQTDVFYPAIFLGRWTARREIVISNLLPEESLPRTITYEVRFLPSIEENAVVADRGFNAASLQNALSDQQPDRSKIRSYEWVESNPNDLRLVQDDGTRTDIKVTKRVTERTEDAVSSSEFQRVFVEDAGGVPVLSARRVLTKWKVINDNAVEGFEIVYDVGSMGGGMGVADPLLFAGGSAASSPPRVISKSRLRLERIR